MFEVAFATSEVIVAWRKLNGEYRIRIESAVINDLTLPAGFTVKSDRHASAVVHGETAVMRVLAVCSALYIVTP